MLSVNTARRHGGLWWA